MDIPDFGLGTYLATDHAACRSAVETALEMGYRHVDTAEGYENERAVGEGLANADVPREDVFVATKVSPDNLRPADLREHAHASADRLGIDTIDLLYVHWPLGEYDPEATLPALTGLEDEGLVRHVGLSNFLPAQLETARSVMSGELDAHQVEMHPLLPQETLHADAVAHDYHLVAYCPVIRGRAGEVETLVDIATTHDATPEQVSLAWLMAKDNVVPIPKSVTPAHIEENWAARELSLDEDEIARIDAIDREERLVDFDGAPWNV